MTEYTVEFVGTGETIEVADTKTILSSCIEGGDRSGVLLPRRDVSRLLRGDRRGDVTQPAARGLTDDEGPRSTRSPACARPQSDLKLDRGKYPPSIEDDAATDVSDVDGAAADDD